MKENFSFIEYLVITCNSDFNILKLKIENYVKSVLCLKQLSLFISDILAAAIYTL